MGGSQAEKGAKRPAAMGYDPLAWIKEEEQAAKGGPQANSAEVAREEEAAEFAPRPEPSAPPGAAEPAQAPEEPTDVPRSEAIVENETIDLGEIVGIADVEPLKAKLIGCLEKANAVTLDGSGLDAVDTSALQLLLAFVLEANKRDFPVHWKEPSATLQANARLIGLERHLGLVA